jgi:hypothetical protein
MITRFFQVTYVGTPCDGLDEVARPAPGPGAPDAVDWTGLRSWRSSARRRSSWAALARGFYVARPLSRAAAAAGSKHPLATAFCGPWGGGQRPPCQGVQRKDMHPIAPRRRPFRPHFTYLHRLVLTRSRCAQLRKVNHFFAHLALLIGRPRDPLPPSNCAKFAGAGSFPPLRPPLRRCAARGWATPSRKAPPSAEDRGRALIKTHRTLISRRCYVLILFRCVPPNMALVGCNAVLTELGPIV